MKVNGEPLERGDEPEELPGIFRRHMSRKKVGETIKLGVLRAKGEPLQEHYRRPIVRYAKYPPLSTFEATEDERGHRIDRGLAE